MPVYKMLGTVVVWAQCGGLLFDYTFLGGAYVLFCSQSGQQAIYSYRLSIVHFWSLIFIYIWAGPHHLLYSSLPDWRKIWG